MKRNPLQKFIPFRLALIIAPLLAAWPQQSRAANQEWTGASAGAWFTLTNWAGAAGFPGEATTAVTGEGLPSDIMSAAVANAATNIGINMNTAGGLSLGAIDFNKTNTATCVIGNSSTITNGTLQLNGATVNAVADTLIRCNGESSLTLSNVNNGTTAFGPITMGVRLGITNGQIFVGQNAAAAVRTLTIAPVITEVNPGTGFTKTGTGTLTLLSPNVLTGLITVSDGALRLQNATAAGTADIFLTNGDGAAVNNNDVLLAGGLTYANNITLENTTNQNARTRLQSTNVLNFLPNTWNGNITFKGTGQNQTILADSAPLIINGDFLQDGVTPSPSMFIRGGNAGIRGTMNGNIFLGSGALFKTDGGTWTINSTGNNMGDVLCADGLLILNNNDALEADTVVQMGQGSGTTGRMQINAGFTQQLTGINSAVSSTSASGHTIFGPGTIDFGGTARAINTPDNTATLNELTVHAPIAGSGGFTKGDTGNLIANGAIAGPVIVAAGGFGGNATLASTLTVNAGAVAGAATALTSGTLTAAGVTLDAGSNVAANIGTTSTGALTSGGTAISLTPNGSLSNGFIPLIGYTGASPGTVPFTLAAPPLGGIGSRATAVLADSGTAIGITISGADKCYWAGTSDANFDVATTANWKLQSDDSGTTFQQMDALLFDDRGDDVDPSRTSIVLNTMANPVRAEFTNSSAVTYSITGTGSLGNGALPSNMVLDKTGDGTVTLATANTYLGATNVSNGVLIANHNLSGATTASIAIPTASPVNVTGSGVVRFAGSNDTATGVAINVPHTITGNGTVEHNARIVAGQTNALASTFTGNNAGFTGTLRLLTPASGTQRLTQVPFTALGTASVDVQSGHQFYAAGSHTFNNSITIAGTGYRDANGNLGALRLDPNSNWAGPVTISAGGARICSHNVGVTNAGIVSGSISGGPLEVNVSNYNNGYVVIFTGTNSYSTTTIGGENIQTAGTPSYRLNIGDGGTTGTLGSGAVTINGDGANGVLGFDRSDGYTLGAGNTITGSGSNPARTFVDLDCRGTGFANNGVAIDLGTAGGTAGQLRAGISRSGTLSTLTGTIEAGTMIVGGHNSGIATTNARVDLENTASVSVTGVSIASGGSSVPNGHTDGAQLNIAAGATLNATSFLNAGEGVFSGGTITQSGGIVTVGQQVRLGHWGSELSTYHMNGGSLTLTGDSSLLTPSTSGAGSTTATGDNNINITNPATIVGGGIYLGIDGTGVFNHTAGTVTTNWIVLDNRGNSTGGGDGIDRYNLSGSALLKLRSEWGVITRNVTTDVSLGGGTIQLDNTGSGGPAGNTGPDLDVPLDAILNTVAATTTTLDTNGGDNSFILTRNVTGAGLLDLTGGGTVELRAAAAQAVSASLAGSTAILKSGAGTTTLSGDSSSYSGTATVNAGTLLVDGSLGGNVTVQSAATLGGNGTTGHVTAESGGIVAPGASVGTLGAASMNLQAGSRYDVEITAAATADKVNVAGALAANGTIKVTLSGYDPVIGNTFDIADAGSLSGTPAFDFSAAVLTAGLAWDTSQFLTNGTISVVTGDPFIAWAAGFGLTGGKDGDDDGDGASNLLEFATDADPTSGGSGARAFGRVHLLGPDSVLTLTVAVRKPAVFAASGSKQTATKDQVVYTVEASDDLALWNAVVVTELNPADSAAVQAALTLPTLGADWEWHTFRTDGTTLLDPRDMIRLSVAAQ